MSPFKYVVWTAMMCALPSASIAQPIGPTAVRPDASSPRALPEPLTPPLPAIISTDPDAQVPQEQLPAAGLYPNPVAGYMGSEMGNSGQAGQQGGFVSQEVVTAGKRQLSRNVVSQEIRQAQFVWEAQRQRVLTDVHSGFYEVLVAQLAVELTDQLVRIGDASVKSAESLMKEKEVGRGDVLQARIESDTLSRTPPRFCSNGRAIVTSAPGAIWRRR